MTLRDEIERLIADGVRVAGSKATADAVLALLRERSVERCKRCGGSRLFVSHASMTGPEASRVHTYMPVWLLDLGEP